MLSAPTSTAPTACRRSISGLSCWDGGRLRLILEPASVARPATSNRFLTANGTPASGPRDRPLACATSIACARLRARPASTAVKELRIGSRSVMRASAASTTAVALVSPPATARAILVAEVQAVSIADALSFEDRGWFGVVGQVVCRNERSLGEDHLKIGAHRRFPRRLDGQRERVCGGEDQVVQRIGFGRVRLGF